MSIYDRIAIQDPDELRGLVAYGLYKRAKRQWLEAFVAQQQRPPNAADLQAYELTWTDQLIETQQEAAESALAAFGQQVVEAARPGIIEGALRGEFWKSVLHGIVVNLIYTLLLIVFVVALKCVGIDLISVLQAIPAKGGVH